MRKLLIILSVLVSGCATTVHLNNQYLNPDEVERLSGDIEKLGYKVKSNNNEVPLQVKANTIVYYPSKYSSSELSELQDILMENGYLIADVVPAKIGNHHYTKFNIGIYLMLASAQANDSVEIFDPSIIDAEFSSNNCGGEVVLDILSNGNYMLESLSDPKAFQDVTGLWSRMGDEKIQFMLNGVKYSYSISKTKVEFEDYFEHLVSLVPGEGDGLSLDCNLHFACQYLYSVREMKY